MLAHALAISSSIGYKKGAILFLSIFQFIKILGDKIICLLDFKRESGLWHSILAVRKN
jgi:hypothetical protein